MGIKVLAVGAAAAVLLAPGAAVLGVATLISPAAAGSGSCMWDGQATESLGVSGPVPDSLSATNTNGETVTLNQQQLTRAATIIATGKSENIPARGQMIAIMTALTESSLRVLSNTGAYPDSGRHPERRRRQRPRLRRSLPTATRRRMGQRRELDGPRLVIPCLLRRFERPESWVSARAARHRRQGIDGSRRRRPGRPGLRLSRPIRRQPAGRGEGPRDAERRLADQRLGLRAARGRAYPRNLPPGFAGDFIKAAASQLGKPYVWGGGNFNGPTGGGFDCSGLVLYAAYQASGGRIRLPHYSGDQIHAGTGIPWALKRPGDLIFFSYPGAGGPHHVAIYVGGDRILHAPRTGDVVRYGTIGEFAGEVITIRRLG